MSIEVRRLGRADAEAYRAIRLESLEQEPNAFGSVYELETTRSLADFADRLSTSAVFGAYAKGMLIGMAGFKQETGPKDSHKGFVWGMYVRADWRGKGVGAALMAAVVAAARNTVEQLTLAVVQDNDTAIALYRKIGFQVYGVEPRALKSASGYSDEVLMVLIL